MDLSGYREIWALDFEFNFIAHDGDRPDVGGRPVPLCLVAHELRSGRWIRLWRHELEPLPPFPTDDRTLFVSFVASAEMVCFRVLGWPIPRNILDLSPEFRAYVSGLYVPEGRGLIGALSYFGLAGRTSVIEKEAWRDVILGGGPYSPEQRRDILRYCESDVQALSALLLALWPRIQAKLPYALIRGAYTGEAQSFMEFTGIPIVPAFQVLTEFWDDIDTELIAKSIETLAFSMMVRSVKSYSKPT